MKFISKYGNEIIITNDPIKQGKLKEQGYTEVKIPNKPKDKTKADK